MGEQIYSESDVATAVKIFERAIEVLKIPNEPTNEEAKDYIAEDGKLDFSKIRLVTIKTWPTGEKFLSLVYFYDGFFTVYADYNPTIAILDFIDEARSHLKSVFPQTEDAKIEEWVEIEATKMTFSLITRLYPRMNLAMRNFTDEVIRNWVIEWNDWAKEISIKSGVKLPKLPSRTFFRSLLKEYEDDVVKLWFGEPDRSQEEKKIQLAREYPAVLRHWQKRRKEYLREDQDWREYAKAGRFLDTPDDLLALLEDSRDISTLALEHTGRRAGLVNPDMKGKHLEMRKQGVEVTGYTSRQLRNFIRDGEKLLSEREK